MKKVEPLENLFYYAWNVVTWGIPYLIKIIIKKAIEETYEDNKGIGFK